MWISKGDCVTPNGDKMVILLGCYLSALQYEEQKRTPFQGMNIHH
nr:hypothetical protein [Lysinibacillus timonensis]